MLPEDDAYLKELGLDYTEAVEGGMTCVVISHFPLPSGYAIVETALLLRLPPGFPDAAPDMWWCDPPVTFPSGSRPPASEVTEHHVGRDWQRFSRHFQGGDWKPTNSGLRTFITVIREDFRRTAQTVAA